MKKTMKINYRGYEMLIVNTRNEGIECFLVYIDFGGMKKRGESMSESGAITIGKTFINRIAI